MIYMRLCGGLGNQMFQAALGLALADKWQVGLKLDATPLGGDRLRDYQLHHLQINAETMTEAERRRARPLATKIRRRLRWIKPFWRTAVTYVDEAHYHFDPSILEIKPPAYFDGYWQTEKYFLASADRVRAAFQLAEPMTELRQQIAARMPEGNAVSLHVRRGDYVANPSALAFHGTCSPQWYEKVMPMMAEFVPDPEFFIFSDDPEWARANLPQGWKMHFIDPQKDKRDFEDMHLMSRCSHHIVANSSFSWWGAWLNPSPRKRVIAPAQWFANAPHDTRDITPPAWIRV